MPRSQGKSQRRRRTSATHPRIPIPQSSGGVPEHHPERHPVRKASQTSNPTKYSDTRQEGVYDEENPERIIASALHQSGEPAMGPIQHDRGGAMDTQGCERASLIALPLRSEVVTKGTPPAPPWNRPPVVRAAVDEDFQNSMIASAGPVCRFGYPLQSKTLSPTSSTAIGGVPRTTKPVQGIAPRYRPVYNWAQFDSVFMAAPDEDWESENEYDVGEHVGIPQQRWMGSEATETQPSGITIAMSPWGNPYPQTYRLHHRAPPQYSYPQANTSCHYPATTRMGYGDSPTESPSLHRRERTTYATTEAAMSYPRASRGATSYVTHTNEAVSTAEGSEEETYGAVDEAYRWQAGVWAEENPSRRDQWMADQYQ